ncbi:hypothetical protein I7I53_09506 [Histoplasma capsulatum var. duboisii H88]|uniref:Uncharacterized protein n=1 Tax=Ajellomyces capsulatus (strain H88) TaxID=544711 RepID=A0A8A1L6W0_AJEC8|nr:hypothetical protein I7I53_09506 [Histoplasma capsulatum var. duboisii H88]
MAMRLGRSGCDLGIASRSWKLFSQITFNNLSSTYSVLQRILWRCGSSKYVFTHTHTHKHILDVQNSPRTSTFSNYPHMKHMDPEKKVSQKDGDRNVLPMAN